MFDWEEFQNLDELRPDFRDYGPPEGDDPLWLCGDHKTSIAVSEIQDSHLLNIERFLLGRAKVDADVREQLFEWWHQTIIAEIERRGLCPYNRPHPQAVARQAQSLDRELAELAYYGSGRDQYGSLT